MVDTTNDINSLYRRLVDEIKVDDSDQIVKTCEKILAKDPQEKDVEYTRIVALLKQEKFTQLDQIFSKPPEINDSERTFAYTYWLYKSAKYDQCINYIRKSKLQDSLQFSILEAQAHYKLGSFSDASQIYFTLLKKHEKSEEYLDILVNLLSSTYFSGDFMLMANSEKIGFEIVSKGDSTRELLFNLSIILSQLQKWDDAKGLLNKFLFLISRESVGGQQQTISEEEMEDKIMSEVQLDFIDMLRFEFTQEQLEKKVQQYEKYLDQSKRDSNLKAVINNNLVCLRLLLKHEQYAESIKLIDQSINLNIKQSKEQLMVFKLNKLLLLLSKNKLPECFNILKDIDNQLKSENPSQQQSLSENEMYITIKAHLLLKSENFKEVEAFLGDLLARQSQSKNNYFRCLVFMLQSEICRLQNKQQQILQNFLKLQESSKFLFENEVLNCFIFSLLMKDKALMENSGQILNEIGQKTMNNQILEMLGEIYSQEKKYIQAAEIYEKILKNKPSSKKYKFKLAFIYSNSDVNRAEQLLADLDIPDLIQDVQEIQKLESELALSKIKVPKEDITEKGNMQQAKISDQTKKIKKHKKKQVRLPKNFDPQNPGALPDPERWLKKYERKGYKKRTAQLMKGPQGSANVGKETTNTFAESKSTANVDTKTQNKKNQKNKKRKNK